MYAKEPGDLDTELATQQEQHETLYDVETGLQERHCAFEQLADALREHHGIEHALQASANEGRLDLNAMALDGVRLDSE